MTLLRCVIAQILWAFYAIGEVPVCEQPPDVDFGNIISDEKLQYVESDTVQYGCNPGYTLAGSQRIKCDGRNWTPPPKCLAPCTITKQQLEEKKLLLPSGRRRTLMIQTDQVVEFSCSEGYVLMVPSNRKCFDGHMDFPLCISETGKKCGRPPVVANGDMTTFAQKEYASGSLVEYTCQKFYSLKGQNKSFCDNGNWIEIPVCEDPCIISQEEMQNHGIELTEAYNGTQYVQYHDFVVFNCKSGHIPQALLSISNFTVQCNSGNIAYPHCNKDELGRCGPAPSIQNGDIISEQLPVYAAGSSVEYKCQRFHGMTGSKTITCRLGKWTAPPICSEIRCDSPTVTNGTYHPLRRVFREEDTISVTCNAGFHFDTNNRNNISECTKTGWIPFPRCTRRPCDYPHIENGALSRTYEYYREQMFPATLGRTIHYQCDQGYTPKTNERYSICTKEGWDPKPQCLRFSVARKHSVRVMDLEGLYSLMYYCPCFQASDHQTSEYINQKGYFSMVLKSLVGHQGWTTDIYVGWSGKEVLQLQHLPEAAHRHFFPRPHHQGQGSGHADMHDGRCCLPSALLADEALHRIPGPKEGTFSARFSKVHMVVDGTFGHLKGRFFFE